MYSAICPAAREKASLKVGAHSSFMGVIRAMRIASEFGYRSDNPEWINLGQGQPEVGWLPGGPTRVRMQDLEPDAVDDSYGPVQGITELRRAVADYYNRNYRCGKSRFSCRNVSISPGGRSCLARAVASLGAARIGFTSPDYPCFATLFGLFRGVTPVSLCASRRGDLRIDPRTLMASAREEQVDAILLSNPRNPCGTSIREERLAELVRFAKDTGILLLLDEHYSQYAYSGNALADDGSLSAAAFLDDPDDPVVMFDGLTKSFRYPGWRLGWTVGPESIIDRITAAGSSLDGGPNRLVQRAAIEVLKPGRAEQETRATRAQFRKKRDVCVSRLEEMGITFDPSPDSTIYAFGSTRNLPGPLSSGEGFFLAALRHCVVTVPGAYFDLSLSVTPDTPSPGIADCVRFSFGPPLEILVRGLNRIELMLHDHIDRPFGGMRSRAPSMIVSAQNR